MMNYQKPETESAFEKAKRIPGNYLYHFQKERSWSKQIVDILYREIWDQLLPGTKHMMFLQTQSFLRQVYDNVNVPDGLCLDVYGRLSKITKDWLPESNDVLPCDYISPV